MQNNIITYFNENTSVRKISDARQKFPDVQAKFSDARQKFPDVQAKFSDARQKFPDVQAKFSNARQNISPAQAIASTKALFLPAIYCKSIILTLYYQKIIQTIS